VLVHVAFTAGWQDETVARGRENQRLLTEQQTLRKQLVPLERNATLRAQATGLIGRSASALPTDEAIQQVRATVVKALGHTGRSRLEVRRGPAPALATVSVAAEGSFFEMVDLVTTLSHPGSGFVLQHVSFMPGPGGVSMTAEALALGGGR
jgi:hypothetical protein